MDLKILTFNWHEPYICLLARVGFQFYIVEPELSPGKFRRWDTNMRPLPENAQILSQQEASKLLEEEGFDLVIANNIKDLVWVKSFHLPKISLFHCRLSAEIAIGGNQVQRDDYLGSIAPLLSGVKNVFISESKKQDWGLPGEVIPHGLDISDYPGYQGDQASVLRVGNLIKEMDAAKGYSIGEQILDGFPSVTLGLNPGIPSARLSRGFSDLLDHYQHCRVYLNTTMEAYEDGYNLSLLEAMATGMPVVSYKHSGSPIVNGVNGFISDDIAQIRRDVEFLLKNPAQARQIGREARKTVQSQFNIDRFTTSWKRVIHATLVEFLQNSGVVMDGEKRPPFDKIARKNILMNYVSHPATTAHYLERALRKKHNVITCGTMINDEVRKLWNLGALKWEVKPQDIPCAPNAPLKSVLEHLPRGWHADLFFWVETGLSLPPADLSNLTMPKACYLIDTHIHLENHLKIARPFNFVFLAQKKYVDDFKKAGYEQVIWLPLACDEEIHSGKAAEKLCDVGFVGTVDSAPERRKRLLNELSSHFNLNCQRKFMDEMAALYSESRIVFNNAINQDLNMRVFEAMCSGSLLVTDRATGSGLEEMFTDKKHLAYYDDATLLDTVRYYLDHEEERERIAAEGRREVLSRHTYSHRMDTMMNYINNAFKRDAIRSAGAQASELVKSSAATQEPEVKSYYRNTRKDLIPLVPLNASCILEVGCASGGMGAELKREREAFVAGVEMNSSAANLAREVLDDVIEGNIESMPLPYAKESFDCIIFADILEHLVDPLSVLKSTAPLLREGGSVVASIPNIQFYAILGQLGEGAWTYQDEGILDRTHLRFFTLKEMKKLFNDAGMEIDQIEENLSPEYEAFKNSGSRSVTMGRVTVNNLEPEELKQFFVFQYKIRASVRKEAALKPVDDGVDATTPQVQELLEKAKQAFLMNQSDYAMRLYDEALALCPQNAEAVVGLGNVSLQQGNLVEAETHYKSALKNPSPPASAWVGLGILEMQRNDLERASNYLNKAIAMKPENDKALAALGLVENMIGNKHEALKRFVQALESNIDNEAALNGLLKLSYELQVFDDAERLLKQYLEVHPANLNILFGLAGIQFVSGQMDMARESLQTLMIFEPNHADARALIQKIDATEKRHAFIDN